MSVTNLRKLATQCELATKWDHELDKRINAEVCGFPYHALETRSYKNPPAPVFTGSIDAAMSLKPKNCRVQSCCESQSGTWRFDLIEHDGERDLPFGGRSSGLAATPALALTAACLRARADQGREG